MRSSHISRPSKPTRPPPTRRNSHVLTTNKSTAPAVPSVAATDFDRRRFLDALLTVGFVSTAAAMAYPIGRYLVPPASGEPAVESASAGRAAALRPNSAAIFKFGSK